MKLKNLIKVYFKLAKKITLQLNYYFKHFEFEIKKVFIFKHVKKNFISR